MMRVDEVVVVAFTADSRVSNERRQRRRYEVDLRWGICVVKCCKIEDIQEQEQNHVPEVGREPRARPSDEMRSN